MTRRDLLGECNDKAVPLDDFQAAWCSRCLSPECSRSLHGQSRFDARVSTWHQRLFEKPALMPVSDPRYAALAAQRFVLYDPNVPEVRGSWEAPLPLVVEAPAPVIEVPEPPVQVAEAPVEAGPPKDVVESTGKVPATAVNTVYTPRMLAGAKPSAPKDPWASAETESDTKVAIGGTVKLGSGV